MREAEKEILSIEHVTEHNLTAVATPAIYENGSFYLENLHNHSLTSKLGVNNSSRT